MKMNATAILPLTTTSKKDKKRKSTSLPTSTVEYLKAWMMSPEHVAHPYPTEKEKAQIMADTGIELKQLTNWFVNNRKRYWKPRVEARLKQQVQAQNAAAAAALAAQRNCEASRVCFNVGIFNAHAPENTIHQNKPQNGFVSMDMTQPSMKENEITPVPATAYETANLIQQNADTVDGLVSLANGQNQGLKSDDNNESDGTPIRYQHYFTTPRATATLDSENLTHHNNVVSIGSASSFADSDGNNSLSNESNSTETQDAIISFDDQLQVEKTQSPNRRKRAAILGSAIAQSLEMDVEEEYSEPPSQDESEPEEAPKLTKMKRERSVSDFAVYSSPNTIVARPRSLTFNSNTASFVATHEQKRRIIEDDWQTACSNASHGYDTSLPGLEEATRLFGFA